MERIEDRSKALSYIGIEIAEALKYIPTPVDGNVEVEQSFVTKSKATTKKSKTEQVEQDNNGTDTTSNVGTIVSKKNTTTTDIDAEIEKSSGKKIFDVFLKYGESRFREMESAKIRTFLRNENQIISAGGGAFENPDNRRLFLENSTVFFLKASAETIYERIRNESHRPLLKKNFSVE